MSDALQRKLRRLGVVKGPEGLVKPKPSPEPIAPSTASTDLPGREISTPQGTFWLDKRVYAADYQHGAYSLAKMASLDSQYYSIFNVDDLGPLPAFVDTETTGLAGGAGTIAFLIGIGIWEAGTLSLHLVFVRNPDEELPALCYVRDILGRCTGLVTFNGRAFDMPLLQTRFIINRLEPNWHELPHLDLLTVARKIWRDHLPSRRLGDIESHILDIVRTEEDLPSYLIPYFYRQYLETGEPTEMRRVMYHNVIDVLSLVSLLIHVTDMFAEPEQMHLAPAEWAGVGFAYFQAGIEHRALAAWEQALDPTEGHMPESCTSRVCHYLGQYYKHRIQWAQAVQIWDTWTASVPDAVNPLVEKAKYYEWTAGDMTQALAMTETAIARIEQHYEGYTRERWLGDLLHRKQRLALKMGNPGEDETITGDTE